MADFRQLALEFVLADDDKKQHDLARQAAQGKSSTPSPPVLMRLQSKIPCAT